MSSKNIIENNYGSIYKTSGGGKKQFGGKNIKRWLKDILGKTGLKPCEGVQHRDPITGECVDPVAVRNFTKDHNIQSNLIGKTNSTKNKIPEKDNIELS